MQTWKIQKKKKKTWKIYKFAFILRPTKPINQREKKPNFYFSIILGPINMYSKILQFIITRGLANPKRKKNFTIFTITLDLAEKRRKKKKRQKFLMSCIQKIKIKRRWKFYYFSINLVSTFTKEKQRSFKCQLYFGSSRVRVLPVQIRLYATWI